MLSSFLGKIAILKIFFLLIRDEGVDSSFQYPTVSAVGFPLTPLWKRGARGDF